MNSFEKHIEDYLNSLKPCRITEAMAYALEGGKRFRPRIIFAIAQGMGISEEKTYDAALALELIQTYSLIHDDLPAMDNDDMRRGKPSLHKAFREDIAILAGDQLLTDSFRVVAASKEYNDLCKVNIIKALSSYSGLDGMIYGQLLDVTADGDHIDKDSLFEIQDHKTGQIFQNQDDLFDMIKTEEQMGKNLSDVKNNKGTALSIYSVEELKDLIGEEFVQLDEYLKDASFDTTNLKELLYKLKTR